MRETHTLDVNLIRCRNEEENRECKNFLILENE